MTISFFRYFRVRAWFAVSVKRCSEPWGSEGMADWSSKKDEDLRDRFSSFLISFPLSYILFGCVVKLLTKTSCCLVSFELKLVVLFVLKFVSVLG